MIYSLFHPAVYPVGRSTSLSFCTWIIAYNSLCPNQISTKIGSSIRLWMRFQCAKFQSNCSTRLRVKAIFVVENGWRRRKKTKKKTRLFDQPYLTNDTCELNEICYNPCYRWRALIMQKLCAFDKGSWSYACVKNAFLLILLIYSRCGAQALFTWP